MTRSKKKPPDSSQKASIELPQSVGSIRVSSPTSIGDNLASFEERLRKYTGTEYVIGVKSAEAAARLCFSAAAIGPGDLVITTPFAFTPSLNVLLEVGAVPVFVDLEPRTGNIDPYLVFAAAQDIMQGGRSAQAWLPPRGTSPTGALKAVLPVDGFGLPADLEPILNTAWKFQVKVIEDACPALGATYKGHPAGSLGDYGLMCSPSDSQSSNARWGMVLTDEVKAASRMRAERDGDPQPPAMNLDSFHLDEAHAAQGLEEMGRIDELVARRTQAAEWYQQHLAEISAVEPPAGAKYEAQPSWPTYLVRLAKGLDRDAISSRLRQQGIAIQSDFLPLHLRPAIAERFGYLPGNFPVAEELGQRCLALPLSSEMSEAQVDRVCQALRHILH